MAMDAKRCRARIRQLKMTLSSSGKQLQIIKRQSECRCTSTECQLMDKEMTRGSHDKKVVAIHLAIRDEFA